MLRIIRSHLRGLLRVGLWDCFMDFKAMIFGFEVEASCVGVPANGRLQNVSKNKSSRIFFKGEEVFKKIVRKTAKKGPSLYSTIKPNNGRLHYYDRNHSAPYNLLESKRGRKHCFLLPPFPLCFYPPTFHHCSIHLFRATSPSSYSNYQQPSELPDISSQTACPAAQHSPSVDEVFSVGVPKLTQYG
ncbi:hypothetical protein HOY80DRAFT_582289 [Tuber brumale]|nr:hypothetical protein HOY80DRAFT_582289 [Tuber brumale]